MAPSVGLPACSTTQSHLTTAVLADNGFTGRASGPKYMARRGWSLGERCSVMKGK
ncbi:hypothetical protein O9993_17280 [Vibrio lentus]|nr:hypothetical protein [Vibrio lentus]